ncbi:hypothetical protein AWT69_004718 [Pseudomonas putida]|nr:hypothetical protein AWT69_004718 [Pseudomonas putida]
MQLDASERFDRGQAGAKIQKRTAHTEHERADDGDERPPEELQQTYQGFWVSRLRSGLRAGPADRKTLAIISIFRPTG